MVFRQINLVSCSWQLQEKLLNRSEFRNYSEKDKEDCFSYACEKCVTGIKNYNFKYTNAFAYFT